MGTIKTVNKLNLGDSYKVCDWLMKRGVRVGDTQTALAREAASTLGMPRINSSHITERLRQLEMKIPEKPEVIDQDKAIRVLAQSLVAIIENLGGDISVELRALL